MERYDKKKRFLRKGESQEKDGRYKFRYRDNFGNLKTVYSWRLVENDKTPSGKKDSKPLRVLEKEIEMAQLNNIDYKTSNEKTLNEFWEQYLSTRSLLKTSTIINYKTYWKSFVASDIGRLKITEIDSSKLIQFYLDLYNKKKLAPSTIRIMRNMINPVLERCVFDRLILANPNAYAFKIAIDDIDRHFSSKKAPKEKVVLTLEQERALIDFLENDPIYSEHQNFYKTLLLTGARVSEVCGLTIKDIDFENEKIKINKSLMYKQVDGKCKYYVSPGTKTEAGERDFPIYCDLLKNALQDEISKHTDNGTKISDANEKEYDGWVFRTRGDQNPMYAAASIQVLSRLINAYNKTVAKDLQIHGLTNHSFRHSFITKCIKRDVSERVLKKILGHAPDKHSATEIYIHLDFEYILKELKKLND